MSHKSDQYYSLSLSQKRFWYLLKNNKLDNNSAVFSIQGKLCERTLAQAIQSLISSLPILNSTIVEDKQRIARRQSDTSPSDALQIIDMRHQSNHHPHLTIQQLTQQTFNLHAGPLYRFSLIKLEDDSHYFVIVVHPLVMDEHSFSSCLSHINNLYNDPNLQLPRQQYSDYQQQEELYRQSNHHDQGILHWCNLLGDDEFTLKLPTGIRSSDTTKWQNTQVNLSSTLQAKIFNTAKTLNCTALDILVSSYALLLHRLSNEQDVLINTYDNIVFDESQLLGCTENQTAYRFVVNSESNLQHIINQTKPQQIRNRHYHKVATSNIVRAIREKINDRFSGIFSNCDIRSWNTLSLDLTNTTCRQLEEYRTQPDPDGICLYHDISNNGINCRLVINGQASSEQQQLIQSYFTELLQKVCTDSLSAISKHNIFNKDLYRHYCIDTPAHNRTEFPRNAVVDEIFEHIATKFPDNIAVKDQEHTLTYSELKSQVDELASYLQSMSLPETQRIVAVYLHRGVDAIITLFGILRAGLAYAPISSEYPEERIDYILQDTNTNLVITTRELSSQLPSKKMHHVMFIEELNLGQSAYSVKPRQHHALSPAYVIYTSGSTGAPKGVVVNHRNINRLALNNHYCSLDQNSIIAHASSIAFDAATFEIFGSLLNGGQCVCFNQDTVLSSVRFHKTLQQHDINTLWMTVALFNQFASEMPEMFSQLDYLLVGGDALNPEMIHRVHTCEMGSPKQIVNGYGPTETTTFAATYNIPSHHGESQPIPIGKPIANTTCYVLDEHHNLVPHGFVGELYIGGDGVALGYLNRDEQTQQRFITNPYHDSDDDYNTTLYKTGDLVRRQASGIIEFVGRADNQVKIRGFRIELGEIENAILCHPLIEDAVVLVSQENNGDKSLSAFYIVKGQLPKQELAAYLQSQLPGYMIPDHFQAMDQFPITNNGKVDRKALLQPYTNSASTKLHHDKNILPMICVLYAKILNMDPDSIKPNADFFELGGHSLKATQLVAYIRQTLNLDIAVKDIFEKRTPQAIAQLIESQKRELKPQFKLQKIHPGQVVPLSFQMKRGWYLYQMNKSSHYYNLPFVISFDTAIDALILREALTQLLMQHDIFNLHYSELGEQMSLAYRPKPIDIKIQLIHKPEQFDRLCEQLIEKTFNLAQQDSYHAQIISNRYDNHCYLLFNIHHNYFDGWSLSIFMNELARLYEQLVNNEDMTSPNQPFNYQDYAQSQVNWYESGAFENQLTFWKQKLSGDLPILKMPCDFERPLEPTTRGDQVNIHIDQQQADKLRQLAQTQGVSLFTLLLTVYAAFLNKYTEQDEIIIGTPIANRNQPDLEHIIGCFVNTIAYRINLSGSDSLESLLQQIHKYGLEAVENQEVPFDLVAQSLDTEHQAGISYVFQTIFSFQSGISLSGSWLAKDSHYTVKQLPCGGAKTDLALVLYDMANGSIQGELEFACDLYRKETIQTYVTHFVNLLDRLSHHFDVQLSNLSLLTRDQRLQLAEQFKLQQRPSVTLTTIDQRFKQVVSQHPDIKAIIDDHKSLTYAELDQLSSQCAHLIQQRLFSNGYQADLMIGLCMNRTVDTAVALLGILKAGCAFFLIDSNHPAKRIQTIIEQSHVQLIITDDHQFDAIQSLASGINLLNISSLDNENSSDYLSVSQPHHLAYAIFTSGSTGKPKGVLIEHKGVPLLAQAVRDIAAPTPGCRCTQLASLNFDASVYEYFAVLLNAGTLYIASDNTRKQPDTLLQFLHDHDIEYVPFLPPAMLEVLPTNNPPKSLKHIVIAGDSCAEAAMRAWSEHCQIINAYGPSEATVFTTYNLYKPNKHPKNIGRPLPHVDTYVLDKRMNPQPPGLIGELYIGGDEVLARGYLDRDDLTVNAFITNPYNPQPNSFLYKTGDLVKQAPNGDLIFIGRTDAQIKLRGFRIELGEIESVLNRHQAIQQVVVNVIKIEEMEYLVTHFVANEALDSEQLRSYCRSMLPDYMTPNFFVQMDALPLNINGKVDRKSLPIPSIEQAGEIDTSLSHTGQSIARIWQSFLGPVAIAAHDNFFQLGGNSFSTIRMLQAINQSFDVDIQAASFLALPTLASLEQLVAGQTIDHSDRIIEQAINDAKLHMADIHFKHASGHQHILLTGANGFVGCHIIQAIKQQLPNSQIICLVRGDEHSVVEKMQDALSHYDIDIHADSELTTLCADLSKPMLGLSEQRWAELATSVDCIIHNGAYVHHILDYQTMKATNVDSTRELIKLCATGKTKQLHYISTISAATAINQQGIFTETVSTEKPRFTSGYLLSKWTAEQLVYQAQQRGLNASICRLGNITGHSQTGASNYHNNHSLLLIKGCLQLGALPDWDMDVDLMPVNIASQVIVSALQTNQPLVYHVTNPDSLPWRSYTNKLREHGLTFKTVSVSDWQKLIEHIDDSNAMYPFKSMYLSMQNDQSKGPSFAADHIKQLLDKSEQQRLAPEALVSTYITYLQQQAFWVQDVLAPA